MVRANEYQENEYLNKKKKKKIRINFPDNIKIVKYFPEVFR